MAEHWCADCGHVATEFAFGLWLCEDDVRERAMEDAADRAYDDYRTFGGARPW